MTFLPGNLRVGLGFDVRLVGLFDVDCLRVLFRCVVGAAFVFVRFERQLCVGVLLMRLYFVCVLVVLLFCCFVCLCFAIFVCALVLICVGCLHYNLVVCLNLLLFTVAALFWVDCF